MSHFNVGDIVGHKNHDYRLTHLVAVRKICQQDKSTGKAASERVETWYCKCISSNSEYIMRIFRELKERPEHCEWGHVRSWTKEIAMAGSAIEKGSLSVLSYVSTHLGSQREDGSLSGGYQCTVLYGYRADLVALREALRNEEDYDQIRRALEKSLRDFSSMRFRILDDYIHFLYSKRDEQCVFVDLVYAYAFTLPDNDDEKKAQAGIPRLQVYNFPEKKDLHAMNEEDGY